LSKRLIAESLAEVPPVEWILGMVCDSMEAATLPARRPSAGAMPGRLGGLLGGKDPTCRFTQKSDVVGTPFGDNDQQ
jgi:hypothetical protein